MNRFIIPKTQSSRQTDVSGDDIIQSEEQETNTFQSDHLETQQSVPSKTSFKRFIIHSSTSPLSKFAKKLRIPPPKDIPAIGLSKYGISAHEQYLASGSLGTFSDRFKRRLSEMSVRGNAFHHHQWVLDKIELSYPIGIEHIVIAVCTLAQNTSDESALPDSSSRLIAFRTLEPTKLLENSRVCVFEPVLEKELQILSGISNVENLDNTCTSTSKALLCRHFDIL
ncbi:hypothetical protein MT418_006011 [Batrachochytrium dendrobatidis]